MPHFRLLALPAFVLFSLAAATAQTNRGFVAVEPWNIGGSPFASATADLNHDGNPDIVIADGTQTTVDSSGVFHQTVQGIVVLLGNGDGTFRAPVHYATTDSTSFVCIADVNGDGNPDVITASFDPTGFSPGGSMEVLLNNGNGTFQPGVKYTVPGVLCSRCTRAISLATDTSISPSGYLLRAPLIAKDSLSFSTTGTARFIWESRRQVCFPSARPISTATGSSIWLWATMGVLGASFCSP
ncbi:MAG TPA: VCBS repeat-containing protein [Silvibacterium sp.]|nr:VCBS repeat-containing protein [Silvibacterium sp.]